MNAFTGEATITLRGKVFANVANELTSIQRRCPACGGHCGATITTPEPGVVRVMPECTG